MGFFDDLGLNEFLDDVRAAGEEFAQLKEDVVTSVTEFGRELTGESQPEELAEPKADDQ